MRERPILFSGPMVRALLEGRKTQTRRIMKEQPEPDALSSLLVVDGVTMFCGARHRCPYGVPGDRLWVKEAWRVGLCADGFSPKELDPPTWLRDNGGCWYEADGAAPSHPISPRGRYRHSRFMPRWASRLTREVTGVRVERVQGISDADCLAEGFGDDSHRWLDIEPGWENNYYAMHVRDRFRRYFNGLRDESAFANPWVWVIEFRVLTPDAEGGA